MTAAVALFLLGLIPAFVLPVLQVILLMVLGEPIWQTRLETRGALRAFLSWPKVAFWQFAGFFFVNAGVFAAMEGAPAGFRPVAVETWTGKLLASEPLMLWLQIRTPLQTKQALLWSLPAGLPVLLGWVIAGLLLAFYVWRISQGARRRVIILGKALGFPTLISKLIVQLPVLRFVRARNFIAMFPALVALGVVLTLYCLTDSVYQSGAGVLIYMVALFTAPRASAA